MANPNQLFLLADHIKLSLLERQRVQTLKLDSDDSQDSHISRSLDQFRDGLGALQREQTRLEEADDEEGALTISDVLPGLQTQFDDLTSQFHGFSSPSAQSTLTHPNDPALSPDFEHATNIPASGSASSIRPRGTRSASKTVRFTDNPSNAAVDLEAQQLFGDRYRDNPTEEGEGYRDEAAGMTNQQVHAYHQDILNQQDDQLDRLGESIARQRELSMQIGDELDDQVAMLDDVDESVDRHAGRLDQAKRGVNRLTRAAGESKQMIIIIVLIIILVLLIAILK